MGHHVVDARQASGAAAVEAMTSSFAARESASQELSVRIPEVARQARGQLIDILADVRGWKTGEALGAIA